MRVGYLWLTFIYHNHYIQSETRCNESFHRFALAELRVVIAVIAILASLLLLPLSIAIGTDGHSLRSISDHHMVDHTWWIGS